MKIKISKLKRFARWFWAIYPFYALFFCIHNALSDDCFWMSLFVVTFYAAVSAFAAFYWQGEAEIMRVEKECAKLEKERALTCYKIGKHVVHAFDNLKPGQEVVITAKASSTGTGKILFCRSLTMSQNDC